MAGAEGFEPSTKVLETHVLPLHHAPNHNVRNYMRKVQSCQVGKQVTVNEQNKKQFLHSSQQKSHRRKKDVPL